MHEIILTKYFHPNEHVGAFAAEQTQIYLASQGVASTLIDIQEWRCSLTERSWYAENAFDQNKQYFWLRQIEAVYPDALFFDFHDSDVIEMNKTRADYPQQIYPNPNMFEDHDRVQVIEFDALYEEQTDPEILDYANYIRSRRTKNYYTTQSNIEQTLEQGILTSREIEIAGQLIIAFVNENS